MESDILKFVVVTQNVHKKRNRKNHIFTLEQSQQTSVTRYERGDQTA